MTTFDDRERGEEARFRHDQEIYFKVRNRRNKLLGLKIANDYLGLHGDDAAQAFHTYASFVIGSTLFVTIRAISGAPDVDEPSPDEPHGDTRAALQRMMVLSATDPQRDEELFLRGLREIVAGFRR